MKRILLLLLIPFTSMGQTKGDNTIIADTTVTIAYLKSILFQNGYTVDNQDTVYIITTPKTMKHAAIMKLLIAKTDTNIILKAQRKVSVELVVGNIPFHEEFEFVSYHKNKNNLEGECWYELNKIAGIFSQKLTYKK